MNKFMPLFGLLLCILFLSGCQHLATPPAPTTSRSDIWSLSAKASVLTPEDSVSGSLTWQQKKNDYSLTFSHPLASQDWILTGSKQQITLRVGQKNYTARSPEELLLTHLHWSLPISSLPHWVRGKPDTHHAFSEAQYNPENQYRTFRQQGFLVEYLQYEIHSGRLLPALLRISSPHITLKLKIHQWQ